MVDDGLSTEQLKSLEEFLPTSEEIDKLKSFKGKGDPSLSLSSGV